MMNRSNINILYKSVRPDTSLDRLAIKTLTKLISTEKVQFNELNILFSSDKFIKSLNRNFRGKDETTDILTFYYETGNKSGLMGDITVSLQTARRQAKELGHGIEAELRILLVHGFYHLLGFDHVKNKDYLAMNKKESCALKKLGV